MRLLLRPKNMLRDATCELTMSTAETNPENILQSDSFIYADVGYIAYLLYDVDEPFPERIYYSINNGDYVLPSSTVSSNEERQIKLTLADNVFSDCYGYMRLKFQMVSRNKLFTLTTPLFGVMLKNNAKNEALQRMAKYVYSNYNRFLKKDVRLPAGVAHLTSCQIKGVEAQTRLLEMIADTYERNQSFFMTNARTKAEWVLEVSDSERLNRLSPTTMQYIAQHPDDLQLVEKGSGIVFGGKSYYPRKTLMQDIRQTRNTYENVSIVSFLKTVILGAESLADKLSVYDHHNKSSDNDSNGYFLSSVYILQSIYENLSKNRKRIVSALERLRNVYWVYMSFMSVSASSLKSAPRFTAIFRESIPYHQIFNLMISWFGMGEVDVASEQFMLPMLQNCSLYEYYVFLKIAEGILEKGYIQSESDSKYFEYTQGNINSETHNNTLAFKKENEAITLYFQPVIYGQQYLAERNNNIYLRRSTSLLYQEDKERIGKTNGHNVFYTPDCIIKYSDGAKSYYLIVDAKYKSRDTVMRYDIQALSFKYLFSVQTTELDSKLVGAVAIYGRTFGEEAQVTSVHDIFNNGRAPGMYTAALSEDDLGIQGTKNQVINKLISLATCDTAAGY